MSRYLHYLIIMCMLTNTVLYIPNVLLENRFSGTMPAVYLSIVSGTICTYFFIRSIRRFPKMGIPEIFRQEQLPAWLRQPYLLFLALMWFIAGGIVLYDYARLFQLFINPDINLMVLSAFFIVICAWVASGASNSILYMAEIVLIIHIPLIGFILFKSLSTEYMDYDAIRVILHYSMQRPSWLSLCSATYVFTGYINMAVFNRTFDAQDKVKYLWIVPLAGTGVLLTSLLIPVGFHGTYGVGKYVYVWLSTADSIRIEFGFVERVLFVYMLLYFSVSLVFISVTWHVGSELLKGVFSSQPADPEKVMMKGWSWVWFLLFGTILLIMTSKADDKQVIEWSKIWFMIRYPCELSLVLLMVWLARRKKQS